MRSFRWLISVVVLVLATSGCASHKDRSSVSSTTTTTNVGRATPDTVAGLSAAQMAAHLGVGVPSGWVPVDEGAARVWVPNRWILVSHGQCIGDPSAPGMVGVGGFPDASCDSLTATLPNEALALVPSSARETGKPALTIHGYRVYAVTTSTTAWKLFDVPQLGVRIATHGRLGIHVLDTLAPSARTVALAFVRGTGPEHTLQVAKDGVSLSIPSSWTEVTPSNEGCESLTSDFRNQLVFVTTHLGPGPLCPFREPTAGAAAPDGVVLYLTAHNAYAPSASGRPVTTVHQGSSTITIYADVNDSAVLDLFVRRRGSNVTHVLTLGLGRDGRAAGRILASIHA